MNATMRITDLDTDGGGGQSDDAAYNAMESPDVSPYYPDMKGNFKLPKKLAAFYEKDNMKRTAKEPSIRNHITKTHQYGILALTETNIVSDSNLLSHKQHNYGRFWQC